MFILLHWYCLGGFGCDKMVTFTLKIFNIFCDVVHTRRDHLTLSTRCKCTDRYDSKLSTQVLGSIPFTPSVVTKWHDRHRYLSIHHVPYLMSLSSPRHCSKTLSLWYTTTPGWTSKFGKVWKTRCQNAATRANIWRCFLVSWDDKYLWVMVSNNRHKLYFCSKLLCFSSIH